ncbi:MAG: LrgB family protein [Fusobacteriaceae bacterium]
MNYLDDKLFGIIISILAFEIGKYVFKKTKLALFNPLLIAGIIVISVISIFKIPLEYYNNGGDLIAFFLAPATVLLIVPLYKQLDTLKKNYIPILVGGLVGSIVAMLSIYFGGKLLGIDSSLLISLVPKSITTPFGIEASKLLGGIPSITVFGIITTGIIGNMLASVIFKFMGDLHPIAKGVGIGVASHAVGTSRAIELGEVEGAMSALSIVVAGIMTIVILQVLIIVL